MNKKDVLCYTNFSKDLIFINELKPVSNHKKMRPQKSCFKDPSHSTDHSRLGHRQSKNERSDSLERPSSGQNRQRPFSQDPKPNNSNIASEMTNKQQNNIQIITPNVAKIVNNNYNNYYITPNPGNLYSQYIGADNLMNNMEPVISGNNKPLSNTGYENNNQIRVL